MRYKESFIEYLRFEKRFSKHTILAYENDLKQYFQFAESAGQIGEIPDSRTLRMWIVSAMENKISSRSIQRKMSSVRGYCKYLIRAGQLKSNPLDRVLKPKISKRLPEFIEEERINRFLDEFSFGDSYSGLRNQLILELLYQTGIRRAELAALKLNSYQPHKSQLLILGKRDKERLVPVSEGLRNILDKYITLRNSQFPGSAGDYLFLTKKGLPVYDKLIYRIVKNYLALVTSRKKKSPHILRHTFATHLLNKGADLNAIKELLGHSNLSATQVYTHNSFENLKKTYKKAHPRAD